MSFEDDIDKICCKAARRSERDNMARQDNGSDSYWRKQQQSMEAGGNYDLLAPWIKVKHES